MPLTHLEASPKQSHCIHVTHFVVLPLLINISSLFTKAAFTCLTVLELWGIWVFFTFFSLRVLWVWPWSNYRSNIWRFHFLYCFIMWALWSLLRLELWLIALQINLTWPELFSIMVFFSGQCQLWQGRYIKFKHEICLLSVILPFNHGTVPS